MLRLFTIAILLLSTISSLAQAPKVKDVIIGNLVKMSLPADFNGPLALEGPQEVNNSLRQGRFLHKNYPIVILFQLATTVDSNAVMASDNDIPEWADKQMGALKKSPGFEYIDDGIFLQDGKNIGYIKYNLASDSRLATYNMLFFMSVNDRLFQATFFCLLKNRRKWEPIADEIANSLRVIPAE